MDDLEPGLKEMLDQRDARLAEIQSDLEKQLGDVVAQREAIQVLLRNGKSPQTQKGRKTAQYRPQKLRTAYAPTNGPWKGKTLTQAMTELVTEHPDWKPRQILDRLSADNFPFRGDYPLNTIATMVSSMRAEKNQAANAQVEVPTTD